MSSNDDEYEPREEHWQCVNLKWLTIWLLLVLLMLLFICRLYVSSFHDFRFEFLWSFPPRSCRRRSRLFPSCRCLYIFGAAKENMMAPTPCRSRLIASTTTATLTCATTLINSTTITSNLSPRSQLGLGAWRRGSIITTIQPRGNNSSGSEIKSSRSSSRSTHIQSVVVHSRHHFDF